MVRATKKPDARSARTTATTPAPKSPPARSVIDAPAKKAPSKKPAAAAAPLLEYTTVKATLRVLEGTPSKVTKFILASNRSLPLRARLHAVGFDAAARREGWLRLSRVLGYLLTSGGVEEGEQRELDPAVRDAVIEIDGTDEDSFRSARGILEHEFPEQHAFVIAGQSAQSGPDSVPALEGLLDRVEALKNGGKARGKAHPNDRAAWEQLAKAGFDDKKVARLRALISIAKGEEIAPEELPSELDEAQKAAAEKEYLRSLRALRAWFEKWRNIARSAVKRKDQRIALGLAKIKQHGAVEVVEEETDEDEAREAEEGGSENNTAGATAKGDAKGATSAKGDAAAGANEKGSGAKAAGTKKAPAKKAAGKKSA